MPLDELETHPYLYRQINNFTDQEKLNKYCKLIIGTFPIYAITNSIPIEGLGVQKRANWLQKAFMQYFYGSRNNQFWDLFCTTFHERFPNNSFEAIQLLDKNQFLITDVFTHSFRNGYSSFDIDLVDPTLHHGILDLIENSINLKIIYFTSIETKLIFCKLINRDLDRDKDSLVEINGRPYRLIVLMTPSSTRSAFHFRHHFPLSNEEINNRVNGVGYALAYRQRYYNHFLTLPCDN